MSQPVNEYDLIIVGAGVVGCAAAKVFGEDGRKVLLLERDLSEPDRIVGELMQPGGIQALKTLGMEDCTEDIDGIACYGYGVYRNGESVELPYSIDPSSGKQFRGIAFHHGRFIQKLRQYAKAAPNVTVKEATVTRLLDQDERVIGVAAYDKTKDKEEAYYAPLTLVADGIFSKFRKDFTDCQTKVLSHFVGFLLHDFKLPYAQKAFVVIAKPSPILMYQIDPHNTRVLVDVPGEHLPKGDDLKKYILDVIVPQLPEYMQGSFKKALETERLRPMPSGFLPPSINQRPGTILLGDALNVRSPLTGGGMTVALYDVLTCRDLLSRENVTSFTETDLVLQAMDAFHWKRKKYSTCINVLAMTLYSVFAADDNENLMTVQNGCFEYFKSGDEYTQGPVDLVAGVNPSPLSLIYHFISVVLYAIYIMFAKGNAKDIPKNIVRAVSVLYTGYVTLFPFLWGEFKG
ncbi:hypothetical protein G6F70_000071 [Rhizopus microsporus]|uniref:Squalene monooxygenase n=2 Tax=Rhizopus TaxID=4842 RepID=A0A367JN32_RHIAZ|nr:hypothetical protein G6F71_003622 [Rhizopus microsporus]RCH91352.1 Squalene epoxidase [Rhizopus azygosporus]KAG1204934.1 hypothetical protein G6F70_000071 [Rhizopus microsporus]KAG1216456.1 hypothetical protein G6F69_000027 [Rhizopus microsporus]KAG1235510.1 hypothetical protein G6F67_002714 [Rhizopus microsporus]